MFAKALISSFHRKRNLTRRSHRRVRFFESLEPRLLLTTATFNVGATGDPPIFLAGSLPIPLEPYSIRGAMIKAHQSTADTVVINLQANQTYEIERPTVGFIGTRLTFSEFSPSDDPLLGDFDISRDMVINGNGATIDADGLARIFQITGGVNVTINDVTIRNGLAPEDGPNADLGGAIHITNGGGTVTINGSTITSNRAEGDNGRYGTERGQDGETAGGGAIFISGGELILDDSTLSGNEAVGGDGDGHTDQRDIGVGGDGGDAYGGGIYAVNANITVRNSSTLDANQATAGSGGLGNDNGGEGGNAYGGGIYLSQGTLSVSDSTLVDNRTSGGNGGLGIDHYGGVGGGAYGGAVHVNGSVEVAGNGSSATFRTASVSFDRSSLDNNIAQAGYGGDGDDEDSANAGGRGGLAEGGALFAGDRVLTDVDDTTFDANQADAGNGGRGSSDERTGRGGYARGGAIYSAGELDIRASEFSASEATGGDAGEYRDRSESSDGGDAFGGAIFASWSSSYFYFSTLGRGGNQQQLIDQLEAQSTAAPELTLTDTMIANSRALGGRGSNGYDGQGDGVAAGDGGLAQGGAVFVDAGIATAKFLVSLLTDNKALGGRGGNVQGQGTGGMGGDAAGGAIYNEANLLFAEKSSFGSNVARGGGGGYVRLGPAGRGGAASGGAITGAAGTHMLIVGLLEGPDIVNLENPSLAGGAVESVLVDNQALGGPGGQKFETAAQSDSDDAGNGGDATGGAIYKVGSGSIEVEQVVFAQNLARAGYGGNGDAFPMRLCGEGNTLCAGTRGGDNGDAYGGAIATWSELTVVTSAFSGNVAATGSVPDVGRVAAGAGGNSGDGFGLSGGDGGDVLGGAIAVLGANANISDSGFALNSAIAGAGGQGGSALSVRGQGNGGDGGLGGNASGGGIGVLRANQTVAIARTVLMQNSVIAGRGGDGGNGTREGWVDDETNSFGGDGGHGGDAFGGGFSIRDDRPIDAFSLVEGDFSFTESIASGNKVAAGDGAHGGFGGLGSIHVLDRQEESEGRDTVGGHGGNGGDGGDSLGGGIYIRHVHATIERSTIDSNIVSSGWGGHGGNGATAGGFGGDGGDGGDAGLAAGGGVALDGGTLLFSHSTVVNNVVVAGFGGNGGSGAPGRLRGGHAGDAGNGGSALGGGIYNSGDATDLIVIAATLVSNTVNAGSAGFVGVPGPVFETLAELQTINESVPRGYRSADETNISFSSMSIFSPEYDPVDPDLVVDAASGQLGSDRLTGASLIAASSVTGVGAGVITGILVANAVAYKGLALTSGLVVGTFAITALPVVALTALVLVSVKLTVEIVAGLADGQSFEESVRGALGEPIDIDGVNFGVLFLGGNSEGPPLILEGFLPAREGETGNSGVAEGPGVFGGTTLDRALVANNTARRREFERSEETIAQCVNRLPPPCTFFEDVSYYELTQNIETLAGNDLSGGAIVSRGTNLVGVTDNPSAFESDDLLNVSADSLRIDSELHMNGGFIPTVALLPGSPAFKAVAIDEPDTAQNGFQWEGFADIGAWGAAANRAPSFAATNPPQVAEDAGVVTLSDWASFDAGHADEGLQEVLEYRVTDVTNPSLFKTPPRVNNDGSLSYETALNAFGNSTFAIEVKDNGGTGGGGVDTSTTQEFTISVTPVNDPPTATLPSAFAITIGNSVPLQASAADVEDGESVSYHWDFNSDDDIDFTTSDASSTVPWSTLQALSLGSGEHTIRLFVEDQEGTRSQSVESLLKISPTFSLTTPIDVAQNISVELDPGQLSLTTDDNPASSTDMQQADSVDLTTGDQNDTVTLNISAEFTKPVSIFTSAGDDTIVVSKSLPHVISGGAGNDTLQLLGGGIAMDLVTLTIPASGESGMASSLVGIEHFDIRGNDSNSLRLNIDAVLALSDETDTISIRHDDDDTIDYGNGWSVDDPEFEGGVAIHIIRQGSATLRVENDLSWQNPLNPLDSNRDGKLSPLDALVTINRLNTLGPQTLADPTVEADLPEFYYDANGDGSVSPIDVLVTINRLNDSAVATEGEGPATTGKPAIASAAATEAPVFHSSLNCLSHQSTVDQMNRDRVFSQAPNRWTGGDLQSQLASDARARQSNQQIPIDEDLLIKLDNIVNALLAVVETD